MKTLFVCVYAVFFSLMLQAQPGTRVNIEQQKIAYIKEKLVLTDAQQKLFLPLYSQWQSKEHVLRSGKMDRTKKLKMMDEIQKLSNAEINKMIDDELAFRSKLVQLERYYLTKIRAVIPPQKVIEMFRLQESFKRELLRKYRNSKPHPPLD